MKSVLISIKPNWCELIANGKKTVEVRKTRPMIDTPFKVYIYVSKGKTQASDWLDKIIGGKVIGEFVCDRIGVFIPTENDVLFKRLYDLHLHNTALSLDEIRQYLGGKVGFGWHISDLKIYDKPRELSEFRKPCKHGEEAEYSCFQCGYLGYSWDDKTCGNRWLTRPPQSWCYVEEMPDET